MGIAFDAEGMRQFERPILVQEYLNHDATIEKVMSVYSLPSTDMLGVCIG